MIYTEKVKHTILGFLQEAFCNPRLYGNEPNGAPCAFKNDYLWSPDRQMSKILILDQNTENLEEVGSRPALIASRSEIAWGNLGINKFLGADPRTGSKSYLDTLNTGITINCFDRNGLVAEFLATLVFNMVEFYKEDIHKIPGVFDITSNVIGQESIVASDSQIDLSVVPVRIGLVLENSWKVTPKGIDVDGVGISINFDKATNASNDALVQKTEISADKC